MVISGTHGGVLSGYCPSKQSIKMVKDVATGPNLSLTTDHMFILPFLHFGCIQ